MRNSLSVTAIVTTTLLPTRRRVRVGLICPQALAMLNNKIGFATSAGAIAMAHDRITSEQLLPNVDFRYLLDAQFTVPRLAL